MSEEHKIYVADLSAYNNGILHGVWIDATSDMDDIQRQVHQMLKRSPVVGAEEYAIHDYEGFSSCSLGEYEGLARVHEVACFLGEHGDVAGGVLSHFGGDLDDARKALEESYNGCYRSLADYAEELTDSAGDTPKHLESYIDYERMGHDLEMSGDVFTIETGFEELHIFWGH